MPKRTQPASSVYDIGRMRAAAKTHNAAEVFGCWHVTVNDCRADYDSSAGQRTRERADQHVRRFGGGA